MGSENLQTQHLQTSQHRFAYQSINERTVETNIKEQNKYHEPHPREFFNPILYQQKLTLYTRQNATKKHSTSANMLAPHPN